MRSHLALSHANLFPTGHSETVGRRATMEDACVIIGNFAGPDTQYYGLFDGHGGREAATYCAENLHHLIARRYCPGVPLGPAIRDSISEVHREVVSRWDFAGTTAAVVVIADRLIYGANVGDSRIIHIRGGEAKRLSFDHKAIVPSERLLVEGRGGRILDDRVNGILSLSRAIGDAALEHVISCEPQLVTAQFRDGDKLIIACDGVWDVMSDQIAADMFERADGPLEAANKIESEALRRGSTDNISVICVELVRT
jgi:serine/threonine protein phosphatase PrpC